MNSSSVEENSLLYSKELISLKLESSLQSLKSTLKAEKKRRDRLSSQLQLTKQQIEVYSQEVDKALEGIKDCNWRITKELCRELRKIPSPSKTIVDVCEKIMLILDQPEKTFFSLKALTKSFGDFKNLMTSTQTKDLSDTLINEILPIWKNQTVIQAKLYKISKCGCLLASWINLLVEYNLKKETVLSSKKREPELEKKIKTCAKNISGLETEILLVKETISTNKLEPDPKIEIVDEEYTEKFKLQSINLNDFCVSFRQEADSKGILSVSNSNLLSSPDFPNFSDKDLYDENSVQAIGNKIKLEGYSDDIGCCKLNFFCF